MVHRLVNVGVYYVVNGLSIPYPILLATSLDLTSTRAPPLRIQRRTIGSVSVGRPVSRNQYSPLFRLYILALPD
jgi:hypothetical protein